jgi:hypothetical protein
MQKSSLNTFEIERLKESFILKLINTKMQSKNIEVFHDRYKARTIDLKNWTYFTKKGKVYIYGGKFIGDILELIDALEKKYNEDDQFNKTLTTNVPFDILKKRQLKLQNELNHF